MLNWFNTHPGFRRRFEAFVLVHIAEQFEVDRHVGGRDETADAVLHRAPERPRARVSHVRLAGLQVDSEVRRRRAPRTTRA